MGRIEYTRHIACMTDQQCHAVRSEIEHENSPLSAQEKSVLLRKADEHVRRLVAQQDLFNVETAAAAAQGVKKARVQEKENADVVEFLIDESSAAAPQPRMQKLPGIKPQAPKQARSALDFFCAHLLTLQEKEGNASGIVPSKVILETRFAALSDVERREFVAKASRDEKRYAAAVKKANENV
jgi:hypothetical protein